MDKLRLLGDAVDSNGALDDAQISTLYDLIGYRSGLSKRLPPGPTGHGRARVARLIDSELAKHSQNLEGTLVARANAEKDMMQLGLARYRDTITRGLRSDLNRARKRFSWALESLRELKRGADVASIVDPDREAGRRRATAGGRPGIASPRAGPSASASASASNCAGTGTGTCAGVASVTAHTTAAGGLLGGTEGDVLGGRWDHSESVGDARRRRARAAASSGLNKRAEVHCGRS